MTCLVCAVGAVVRKVSFVKYWLSKGLDPSDQVDNYMSAIGDNYNYSTDESEIKNALKNHEYLSALSARFETWFCNGSITKLRREKLIKWVKKSFPAKFTVTI